MKYLVDSMEMRAMDRHSIDTIGIPSIVLMGTRPHCRLFRRSRGV